MLAVHCDQGCNDFPQQTTEGGLIVDHGAAAARRLDDGRMTRARRLGVEAFSASRRKCGSCLAGKI
jgi:hypothetical protein